MSTVSAVASTSSTPLSHSAASFVNGNRQHNTNEPASSKSEAKQRRPRRRKPANRPPKTDGTLDVEASASSAATSADEQHIVPAVVQRGGQKLAVPKANGRRKNFGSQVSQGNPAGPNGHSGPSASHHAAVPVGPPPEHSSLQARLTYDLLNDLCECSICMNTIKKHEPVHSCRVCSSISHLKCVSTWASRSLNDAKAKLAASSAPQEDSNSVQWRCPDCQSSFREAELPKQYRCFCSRVANPRNKPDTGTVPHSCGLQCIKARPTGCTHSCPSLCHPGPCQPCSMVVRTSCFCGKAEKQFRCSVLHSDKADVLDVQSCQETCGALLACGLHACPVACHPGEHPACEVVRSKKCFCGGSELKEVCATEEHGPSDRMETYSAGSAMPRIGEYSCELRCKW